MMKRRFVASIGVAFVLCLPATLRAQAQPVPLSEILVNIILRDIVLFPTTGGTPHTAHFTATNNPNIVPVPFQFNRTIATQLSTFPLGSSSGGFTYAFDPTLGTFSRSSNTFGPAFAERALTIGRNKFSLGANYAHTSYNSFEGQSLHDNSIKFYISHEPCCGGEFFTTDLVEAALTVELKTDTVALFGSYGVTDQLDLGVAVPIVHVNLVATNQATIKRLAEGQAVSSIHSFDAGGSDRKAFPGQGSASGLGDMVVRAKYNFWKQARSALAAGVDLRLPTGDEQNLLGTGATQAKLLLIYSATADKVSPHINVGYTVSKKSTDLNRSLLADVTSPTQIATIEAQNPDLLKNVVDEFNYSGGIEYEASPKVTVIGDFIGRTLRNFSRLQVADKSFQVTHANLTKETVTFQTLEFVPGNLNLALGAFGVKVNPSRNLLVSGHVLVPLTKAGLRSRFTTVFGFDYAF